MDKVSPSHTHMPFKISNYTNDSQCFFSFQGKNPIADEHKIKGTKPGSCEILSNVNPKCEIRFS